MCLYSHNCYDSGSDTVACGYAAALKCDDYRLESLVGGYLDEGNAHWRWDRHVNVQGSKHWEGVYSVG